MRALGVHLSTRATVSFVLLALILPTLVFVPSGATAEQPVFEIEGEGSTPWSFEGIKPGDEGTVPVILINNGAEEAWAHVWVSNIVESDKAGDGAWLAHYMLFGLRSIHLHTDLEMPVNVRELPKSLDESTLFIGPIAPGASAELYWDWEFFDNGRLQNEAQGDGLRFNINYQLTSSSPAIASDITFDILGRKAVVPIDETGAVIANVTAVSPDGDVTLFIEKGTRIASAGGGRPSLVELRLMVSDNTSSLPNDHTRFGEVYELVAFTDGELIDVGLRGSAKLTVRIDPFMLPEGTRSIALFHNSDGNWTITEGLNTNSWEAWGRISEFGRYTVGVSPNAQPGIPFFMALEARATPIIDRYWCWPFTFFTVTGESALVEVQLVNVGDVAGTCVIIAELNGRFATDTTIDIEVAKNTMALLQVGGIEGGSNNIGVVGQSLEVSRIVWINWPLIILIAVTVFVVAYMVKRYNDRGDYEQDRR